jgi:hypothetical protein
MAEKHGLNQQISSLNVLRAGVARLAIREIDNYERMEAFHLKVIDEAIATLSFMQAHEAVIRQAIRDAKKLDAETKDP